MNTQSRDASAQSRKVFFFTSVSSASSIKNLPVKTVITVHTDAAVEELIDRAFAQIRQLGAAEEASRLFANGRRDPQRNPHRGRLNGPLQENAAAPPTPSKTYLKNAEWSDGQQAALAGYRLSDRLREILG